ncbi:hypothetical protein, partial [Streptomyces sp. NPDC048341]|uniref:hypothetical protein n=1 Tax=Streptomyces sp. NPDC048341 TaxID=3154620 RepID=UPI0034466101
SSGVALVWQTGPARRYITGQTTSTRNYAGAVTMQRDQFGNGQVIFKSEWHMRPLRPGRGKAGPSIDPSSARHRTAEHRHEFGYVRREKGAVPSRSSLTAVPPATDLYTCALPSSAEARLAGQPW